MRSFYKDGMMQEVLTRLLPIALRFDDNKFLEVYAFSRICTPIQPPLREDNYKDHVEEVMIPKISWGGTEYSSALKKIMNDTVFEEVEVNNNKHSGLLKFLNKKEIQYKPIPRKYPVFVIFIIDGDSSDKSATLKLIKQSAEYGIGNSEFNLLKEIDDLTNRKVDNTGFNSFSNLSALSDAELYNALLEQYIKWLKVK